MSLVRALHAAIVGSVCICFVCVLCNFSVWIGIGTLIACNGLILWIS